MALTFSLINTWDDGKRVHVSGTFGCSCCWPPAGAFVSIHYSAGRLKKFAARRNSTPQITSRDLLFHSNTKVTANSTNIAPAQTPPSSSKTQSENEASPQNQQGTDASLPAPDANAATPAPSRSNAAASASSATAPPIHRRNPRRRSRHPLQLRPRLPRLPTPTHRRQTKRLRRHRHPMPHRPLPLILQPLGGRAS